MTTKTNEEWAAIQEIDGALLCVHCQKPVMDDQEGIPAASGLALHTGCYDAWIKVVSARHRDAT